MNGHVTASFLAIMVVGVLIAAAADVRTRRIPNLLTGTLAAVAIAAHVPGGLFSVASAVLVMLAAFAIGAIVFSFGWFGGGDVKLLAACCGFAGFPSSIELVLYTFIAGGVLSLVEAARQRQFGAMVSDTYHVTVGGAATGRVTVPYGVAIAAGASTFALSTLPSFHFLRLPL